MNGPALQEVPDGQRQRRAQRARTEQRKKNPLQTLRRLVILEFLTEDVTYELERRATLRELPLKEVIALYRQLASECNRLTRALMEYASTDVSEVWGAVPNRLPAEWLRNLRRGRAHGGVGRE